jgi:hypothetical protein
MVANAGTIEAQLILNASNFQKEMQKASNWTNNFTKGVGAASNTMGKSFNGVSGNIKEFNRIIGEAKANARDLGKGIVTSGSQATSTFSKMSAAASSAGGKISSFATTAGSKIMGMGNTLANLTNSFVNFNVWMGALVGKVFYDFTIGAAMARDESLSLFKFVGMGADEVKRLEQATSSYAAAASKVSQPEMLSAWKLIRISQKLSADQMIQYQGVLGDTIGLFKSNGRTAEDAGRAIEDAMAGGADGIKRMKEIGITSMQELYDKGFDPKKPETFFAALQKIYQDRGVEGYGMKVTSLADRFENLKEKIQLAGIAAGEVLMPAMEGIVNAFTAVFEGLGPTVSGAIIAFTGLAVILGFFWPTLLTVGSAAVGAAAKLITLTGGTLAYKLAADGAKTKSVDWGETLGKLDKKMIAAAVGVGIMVAGLVLLVNHLIQANSATIAWKNAEKEKTELVNGLNAQNVALNGTIESLNNTRAKEVAAGRSTVEIDRQIAEARKRVEQNTIGATNAEKAWTQAQSMKAQLEGIGKGKITSSKTRAAAASAGVTPEEYVRLKGTTADYNDELEKTAKLNYNIYSVYDKQAGTIDKITKGTDTYSKVWKSNSKAFNDYKNAYDAFSKSSENFWLAVDEGDIGRTIWFGLESGLRQAEIGFYELQAYINTFIIDAQNYLTGVGTNIKNAILKPFQDAFLTVKAKWDEFWAALTQTGAVAELKNAFNEVKAAVNELFLAFEPVKAELGGLWSELGSAFNEIKGAMGSVWAELSGPVNDLINAFKELIWPAQEVSSVVQDVGGTAQENKEPLLTLKDVVKWVADGIRAAIPVIQLFAGGIRWLADRFRELASFISWVTGGVKWLQLEFAKAVAFIQAVWGGTMAFLRGLWSSTVSAITGNPLVVSILKTGEWIFQWLVDKYNWVKGILQQVIGLNISGPSGAAGIFDSALAYGKSLLSAAAKTVTNPLSSPINAAANYVRSQFTGPAGPAGPHEILSGMGGGLNYQRYGGHRVDPLTALASGGNCFDMTMGMMAMGQALGLDSRMVWGTWNGGSHVWANIGGRNYDPARKALEGTWTPPPRGPARGSGGGNVIINGDVYGYNDFVKKVEKANNRLVRGY